MFEDRSEDILVFPDGWCFASEYDRSMGDDYTVLYYGSFAYEDFINGR